ncbi:uncharacterized protein LOC144469491 isoform X2 [Augochlora pura]
MNEIETCPYDRSHRISKSKLPYHLLRCKLSNSSKAKVCCPFNAFHIINEAIFEEHVKNCSSSGNVRTHLYSFESTKQLGTMPLEAVALLTVPIMEDWKEEGLETYDPWKNTERRDITRCKSGGTRTQKKHYKLAERNRLSMLKRKNIFKPHVRQAACVRHKPLKEYFSVSELISNLRRMSLLDFDVLLKSADLSNLHISNNNKFKEYRYMSQFIEGILAQKIEELVLHCIKNEIF